MSRTVSFPFLTKIEESARFFCLALQPIVGIFAFQNEILLDKSVDSQV